jgi:hypothetical protein
MERLPPQSPVWRAFALFVLLFLLMVASEDGPEITSAWDAAKAAYWLCAPLGLFGYAFGFRILPVSFWRVYAVIFTLQSVIRLVDRSVGGGHDLSIILIFAAILAIIGLALFRYAGMVRGGRTEERLPRPVPASDWLKSRGAAVQLAKHIFGRRGPLVGLLTAIGGASLIGSAVLAIAIVAIPFELSGPGDLLAALMIGLLAIPASAMLVATFAVLFGLPFTWLLSRLNRESASTYGIGGAVLGLVLLLGGVPSSMDLIIKGSGAVYGCACGLLWWHVYRRGAVLARGGR